VPVRFLAGLVVGSGGLYAFVYAHYHDPTPEADPMAVRLLSHEAYAWLHFGGIALLALGTLLVLWEAIRVFR
jgi:hypothetical protein